MNDIHIPDFLEITGGKPLNDGATVHISGAKNEVLGVMCAAVLTDQVVEFNNVPFITDTVDLCALMQKIGIDVDYTPAQNHLRIRARRITTNVLPPEAMKFRASYYIWGALLARFVKTGEFKSLKIEVPGGCELSGDKRGVGKMDMVALGHGKSPRAMDYHANLLNNIFGTELIETDNMLEFVLPKRFDGNANPIYSTTLVSHGATFHWMLATAMSPDLHMMYNAIQEPEIPHLLGILNKMGAKLRGTNTTAIASLGFDGKLLSGGVFDIMPDRMETGFYALLAMALKSRIKLTGTDVESCRPWLNSVIEIAGPEQCYIRDGFMVFDFRNLPDFDGRTFLISPMPGKETDMQQIWTPILAQAKTASRIFDPIWTARTGHLPELEKFGIKSEHREFEVSNAAIQKSLEITIYPSKIHAATEPANGTDLRGTAALIMAAAIANGTSRINNPKFALRGYPNLVQNLKNIGITVNC